MPTRRELLLQALLGGLVLSVPEVRPLPAESVGETPKAAKSVRRVFAAGPPAGVLLYVLAPETLLGWPSQLSPEERRFLASPYNELPYLGRLSGRGTTVPLEKLIDLKPDLILDVGDINPTYTSTAERVQQQTGIPYFLLDGRFDDSPNLLRRAGTLVDETERGELLAQRAESILAEVKRIRTKIVSPPRAYLARGEDGLETGIVGSINTEILEYVGAANVATEGGKGRLGRFSPEQILAWNPEVIVTQYDEFYKKVFSDPVWREVEAVRTKRVHFAPSLPFGWLDGPPGVNRLVGVHWLLAKLFPEEVDTDLRTFTREFYNHFYHLELSESQLDRLLGETG